MSKLKYVLSRIRSLRIRADAKKTKKRRKLILQSLLIIAMFLTMMMAGGGSALAEDSGFAGGDGTSDNPYQIATADQLVHVGEHLSNTYFELIADIDLNGRNWMPIGCFRGAFRGYFDGNGHTISNLYISMYSYENLGLFSMLARADGQQDNQYNVSNLGLVNIDITGGNYIGGIVGQMEDAQITNCYAIGKIRACYSYQYSAGGLVGSCRNSRSVVSNCHASVNITNFAYSTGGLIGYAVNINKVDQCYATGNITMSSNCTGNYTAEMTAGGLIGEAYGVKILNCYASGNISSLGPSGGLVGRIGDNFNFNTYLSTVSKCYSTGKVNAENNSGGLIGLIYDNELPSISISSCYYNSEYAGQSNNGRGAPLTTTQMLQQASFNAWDFSTVWNIIPGSSYPYLQAAAANPLPGPQKLTVGGSFTAASKLYDGTATATITSDTSLLTLNGVLAGDSVTLNPAAVFSDAAAGTGKTVYLTGSTLSGTNAGKYLLSLEGAPTTTADITKYNGPTAPAAPVLVSKTNTSVTLTANENYEFRNNSGEWQSSNVFSGLSPLTSYSFTQRVKETVSHYASGESAALSVTTNLMAGSGTSSDPWQVTSASELDGVRSKLSAYYKLMNNIDLSGYLSSSGAGYNAGAGWAPIGIDTTPFTGGFDGSGHVISNLTINRPSQGYCGLFGCIGSSGQVTDLGLENINIKSLGMSGGLCGYAKNFTPTINHCYVTGVIDVGGSGNVGGIVGWNSGKINNCYTLVSVKGYIRVGGIAGNNSGSGVNITNCYFVGSVTGTTEIGGITGRCEQKANITNCYSVSSVTGTIYTGGIAGINTGSGVNITNCYFVGSVTGTTEIGGITGRCEQNANITNCYSVSSVTGTTYTGGIAGRCESGGILTSSYYNREVSGQLNGGAGTPLTTAQMVQQASFGTEWNFTTVWNINEGNSYPYLLAVDASPLPGPIVLTIGGSFTADSKQYDGTTAATVRSNDLTLNGVLAGDVVTLNPMVVFNDAAVGKTKTVSLTGSTISGANAGKYLLSLNNAPTATADINPAAPGVPTLVSKTNTSVTLTANADYEFSKNGGAWQSSNEFSGLSALTSYSFTQRVKETSTHNASNESTALSVTTNLMAGSGTESDPWQVTSASELDYVRNKLSDYYKLMNNIDLSGYLSSSGAGYNAGAGWAPIGTDNTAPFKGGFNGNGYVISNLSIDRKEQQYCGLFGCVGLSGQVTDLGLANINIKSSGMSAGLCGFASGSPNIQSCYVTGVLNAGSGNNVGGIVGWNDGTIRNCYALVNITGNLRVGGIVGTSDGAGNAKIINCYSEGSVTGSSAAGGILGQLNNNSTITSSYYNGTVSGQSDTGKGTSKSSLEMARKVTYDGWDFTADTGIWVIDEGKSYPYLRAVTPTTLPKPPTYTINVSANPPADGNVTGSGIYIQGQSVTLNAVPSAGCSFNGWYEGTAKVSSHPGYTFIVTKDITLTAKFTADYLEITTTENGGTVKINGGSDGFIGNYKAPHTRGDVVTLTATASEGYTFAYWQDSRSGNILSTDTNYEFMMGTGISLKAVFRNNSETGYTVIFKDKNGKILQSSTVAKGAAAVPPDNLSLTGYSFTGWDKTYDNVTSDMVICAMYKRLSTTYLVNVEGGTLSTGRSSGSFEYDMPVTVIAGAAPTGQKFSHWEQGGMKISYSSTYSFFTPMRAITLTAKYVTSDTILEQTPVINLFTDVQMETSGKKLQFMASRVVPAGYTLIESGVLLLKSDTELTSEMTLDTDGVILVKIKNNSTDQFYVRKTNVKVGDTWYGRAYLIYKDADGNIITVYSANTEKGKMS